MFLKKLILINWGNIPQLEFDFGPINLFSGGNGSGKTTAADAIQALMTAAHDTLFTFNPGQDETTQRGRGGKQVRTLASYVMGCDDGSYARLEPTDCYICGVFHPTSGEDGEPFSAVMGIRAHLDKSSNPVQARQDELKFFILPGEQLGLGDFIREYKDGRHRVPLDKFYNLLRAKFAQLEIYDKKKAYLRRLYGALRGKRDALADDEASHAARTFSNFMAYKPVKSINDFVAREILEKRDLGDAIRSVSELMKTIHSMEQEARTLSDSAARLETLATTASSYRDLWVQCRTQEYLAARHRRLQLQRSYLAGKEAQRALQAQRENNRAEILAAECKLEQLDEQRLELEVERRNIPALRDKDQLEKAIADAERRLSAQALPLDRERQQLRSNLEAAAELTELLTGSSIGLEVEALAAPALLGELKRLARENETLEELPKLLGSDWIDLSGLDALREKSAALEESHNRVVARIDSADAERSSARDALAAAAARWQERAQQTQKQLRAQELRIQQLEANSVRYPQGVEQALAAIRNQCPQADPRVLCDHVEVLDERWQMAVEGYLGGARFSIIVAPEFEAEAIRIVRALPGRSSGQHNRARVIQGEKARRDAAKLDTPRGSIVELMEFSHKTAEYYLRASYASVLQVSDAEELRNTRRGLTADCLASGNYSMWRCDLEESDLVFGQGARARALAALKKAMEQSLIEAAEVNASHNRCRQLSRVLSRLAPLQLRTPVDAALAAQRDRGSAQENLRHLDMRDGEALELRYAAAKEQHKTEREKLAQLQTGRGVLEAELKRAEKGIDALAQQQDAEEESLEFAEQALRQIALVLADFDAQKALEIADQQAAQAGDRFDFSADLNEWQNRLQALCGNLDKGVVTYNGLAGTADKLVFEPDMNSGQDESCFRLVANLHGQIDRLQNRLKNNLLVERHEQLIGLNQSFNSTFVTHLCHAIYQSINDGKRILENLNRELEHHRFGTDRERFYFKWRWVPEFKEYWDFFQAVIQLPNLGEGESLFDTELEARHQRVRDKMLGMLLSDDEQQARRELERISDYRNYRSYDIFKEPEGKAPIALSQYGTGSGGQLETPAYIIRSAAVTSAFRFAEGRSHLRMVLVDEAFSKMDETRSREVIRYLTETLGLQLLFIMPSSKSGPFLDLVSNQVVFSKCPSPQKIGELNSRVFVDRKLCNREKIAELWTNHKRTIRQQEALDFMQDI